MLLMTGLSFLLNSTSFPGEIVLASSPHVQLAVGYKVVDRQLESASDDNIYLSGETVFAWSALIGVPSGFVEHVWTRDGVEVARHMLPVGAGRRWRTWSHVKVLPGDYEVRVIGPDGTALGTTSFIVAEPAGPGVGDDCCPDC
jgi:hypothetical protein